MKRILKRILCGAFLTLSSLLLVSCAGEILSSDYEADLYLLGETVISGDVTTVARQNPGTVRQATTPPVSPNLTLPGGSWFNNISFIQYPYDIVEGEIGFPEGDFVRLNLSFPVDFHIAQEMGDTLLRYRMDSRLVDILSVYIENDVLNINATQGVSRINSGVTAPMTIYLNADIIPETITRSGSSNLFLGSLEFDNDFSIQSSGSGGIFGDIVADNFRFSASGSGRSNINLDASFAEINLSGSGSVVLAGQSYEATLTTSGSGNMDLRNFAVQNAFATASGSSNITVNVSNHLTIRESGRAQISYVGNPSTVINSDSARVSSPPQVMMNWDFDTPSVITGEIRDVIGRDGVFNLEENLVMIQAPFNIVEGNIDWPAQSFNQLHISFPISMHIVHDLGDTLLSYRMDSRFADALEVYVQDEVLNIRSGNVFSWQNHDFTGRQPEMTIYLNANAVPEILRLSGSSPLSLGWLEFANNFSLNITGASNVSGNIIADSFYMNLSGASAVNLSGRSRNANLIVSGACAANLQDFVVNNITVNVTGTSIATVNALYNLDATASGISTISYTRNPSLEISRQATDMFSTITQLR